MKRYLSLTHAIYLFVMCVGVSSPFADGNVPEWFVVSGAGMGADSAFGDVV